MGTIPTPPTFVAGENPTAAKLNQQRDAVNFWANPPKCRVYQTTGTTVATGSTYAPIGFDSEVFDNVQSGDQPMHDNTTNPSRIVIRTAGKYEFSGQILWTGNATGSRGLQIRKNAAGNPASGVALLTVEVGTAGAAGTSVVMPTLEEDFVAGDYVELFGRQTSGGNLATLPGTGGTYLRVKLSGS